jgi:hypothetical protein
VAGGVDIKLHGRTVHTVFDLLGTKEDDITYSVGWGLARSESFSYALLNEVFEGEFGTLSAILLQQSESGYGRTDIELQTQDAHLVVEAKRGWDLPDLAQLTTLNRTSAPRKAIAVVSECARHYPPVKALPRSIEGVPVHYVPWSRVGALAAKAGSDSRNHAEKRLFRRETRDGRLSRLPWNFAVAIR